MGGGFFEGGNVTPTAEFNIYVDPQAADVVLKSGIPIVMMPLDVTHKALTTAKRTQAFRALGTKVGTATAEMLEFFERFDEEKYGTDGGPLHDPCVIAYLLEAGTVQGPQLQCQRGNHLGTDHGHDRDRLVGRHQAAKERHGDARHRP